MNPRIGCMIVRTHVESIDETDYQWCKEQARIRRRARLGKRFTTTTTTFDDPLKHDMPITSAAITGSNRISTTSTATTTNSRDDQELMKVEEQHLMQSQISAPTRTRTRTAEPEEPQEDSYNTGPQDTTTTRSSTNELVEKDDDDDDSDSDSISSTISTNPTKEEQNHHPPLIQFTTVQIRDYGITIGDNPCPREGPSLTIQWKHHHEDEMSLTSYEKSRPTRRKNNEMIIPSQLRFEMLQRSGITTKDIMRFTKIVDISRRERLETTTMLHRSKTHESMERFTRGIRNLITNRKKKEREFLELSRYHVDFDSSNSSSGSAAVVTRD